MEQQAANNALSLSSPTISHLTSQNNSAARTEELEIMFTEIIQMLRVFIIFGARLKKWFRRKMIDEAEDDLSKEKRVEGSEKGRIVS